MVRVEYPDGSKQYYNGPKEQERVVRVEYPDGSKRYFNEARRNTRVKT